jgi:hypothetical protein
MSFIFSPSLHGGFSFLLYIFHTINGLSFLAAVEILKRGFPGSFYVWAR